MYEGLGTDPDPNVRILYIDVDLDARILKNNPDSNGRLPYTLIFPAKSILRLNWSLIFFLRIGGWFLGSLTTAKRTVGSKPSRLKAQVLTISNYCHWPTLSKKVKRYKVLSKKCTTKSTFHLKNESARFCIKDAHSSVQSRLLDDEHRWED